MTERPVVVLVHISEASGLYNGNENVLITASLGGLTLETDNVVPSHTTIFDVNIIWETDLKAIKRMKTENLPIKLECFSVDGTSRTPIGFVIFPIRGVPLVYGDKGRGNTPRWYKFIGLSPQWKELKPEISLYCTITEPDNVQSVTLKRDSKSLESILTANMLCSQLGLYVKLHQEGQYIQLGTADDHQHVFVVHINLRSLKELDMPQGDHDKFHIQYILFGSPSEDRMLVPNATDDGQFSIQEKITIHFRASPNTIREYFNRVFYIPLEVCCNNSIIGFAKFKIDLPELADLSHPRGLVYQVVDRCSLTPSCQDITTLPWIEYELSIRLSKPQTPASAAKKSPIGSSFVSNKSRLPTPNIEELDLGESDHMKEVASPSVNGVVNKTPPMSIQPDTLMQTLEQHTDRNPSHRDHCDHNTSSEAMVNTNRSEPTKTAPKTFSYKLWLKTIEFCRKAELGIWQLSLHHPKAHSPLTLTNVTVRENMDKPFDNVQLVLYFSAYTTLIRGLIESEPCVLHIKGPHGFVATAELDNGTLLDQIAMHSNQVGIIIMENETAEKVAMVQALAELTDLGANLNAPQRKFAQFIRPKGSWAQPHLDEELAYKMVEELEDWKTQQQESFLVDLKRREINHLARLTAEWTRRRADLEDALAHKLEQCTLLTSALEIANHNLQDKQKAEQDRQRQFQESKVELERSCVKKLLHLQEIARRNETDAEHASKLSALRFDELNNRYETLQQEYANCRTVVMEQAKELEVLRTLSLPTNEAAQLLQEMKAMHKKLARVESSKLFYKQQWTNAVRDMESEESTKPDCSKEDDNQSELTVATLGDNSLANMILSEKAHLADEQEELRTIFETLDEAKDR